SPIVTQRRGSSGWYLLGGSYYMDGATTVTLSDELTTGTYVVADALRFLSVFSFAQMSDSHVGYSMGTADTTLVANELKTLGKVTLDAYSFDAPPPSFAIHTGDFTEYGQEYWNTLMSIFSGMPFPVYLTLGNHDSTWSSCREKIRSRHGSPFYAFDHYDRGSRYRFIGLDSTVLQSPRASFSREELDWLTSDLDSLDTSTLVFLFFHHPINGTSDTKPYDSYRLLDSIRSRRVPIIFYGHGHSFNQTTFDGVRLVQGGSTYDAAAGKRGYNLITVTHTRAYVSKKIYGEPTAATGILNLSIPSTVTYPTISITSPLNESIQTGAIVPVSASVSGASATVTAVDYELDGDTIWRPLAGSGGGPYTGSLNTAGLAHGRHWIRVQFTLASGGPYYKTVSFWNWDALPRAEWIVDLGASSLSTPAIADGKVYVGTHGGSFRCVNASNGSQVWNVPLPADVVSSPEVNNGRVFFGCGDGKVYCLDAATGAILWTKTCSGPVYSSPTVDGLAVYVGSIGTGASGSAYLYSLDVATGAENWKYSAANAIETKPFVLETTVFFGAWDSYFYAVNTTNGSLRWRYQRNSNRYYSPADSWPVASASSNRVFVADREYYLNAINITTGLADWTRTSVSSQALTPDGTALFLRNSTGNFERTSFSNSATWSAACSLDSAPVAPLSSGSRAAVVNQHGLVSVVDAATGAVNYRFQVSQSYQLHAVQLDTNGDLYASTYEGYLLRVVNQEPGSGLADWIYY
ncbi:MAG: PQQ-binding-like beta-propeller repeat protein, partial [bacterium]